MRIAQNMLTDLKEVVGGQTYIEVSCLEGKISFETVHICGVPSYPRCLNSKRISQRSYFGKSRTPCSWSTSGFFDDTDVSYDDRNVIANRYNDHSLWRYNNKTLTWLTSLQTKGAVGIEEYLAVLTHHKRGFSYHGTKFERFDSENGADYHSDDLFPWTDNFAFAGLRLS